MAVTNWLNPLGGNISNPTNWDNGVPTSTVDANIGANIIATGKVITIDAALSCANLIISGSINFTLASSVYSLTVYGNLTDGTNCLRNFTGTAYLIFAATPSKTITSNGNTQGWNQIYFNGVGGTWTNQDDWNVGNANFIFVNGTLNTNSKTISVNALNINSGASALTLGASIFNVSHFIGSNSSFVINAGTSSIFCNGNFYSNNGSIFYDVTFSQNTYGVFLGSCTFHNLTINGYTNSTNGRYLYNNITVNNILTITGANATSQRVIIQSNTIGTPRTITFDPSKAVISNCDFQDINCPNAIDLSANFTVGNCGGNTGITFCPTIDLYIKHTSGTMSVSNAAKWFLSDMVTAGRVPLPQDRAWGTALSFTGASTVTMNCPRIGSIDLSRVTQPITWALDNAINVYKSYRMGVNITQTGNFLISYLGDRSTNGSVYLGSNHSNKFNVILSNTFTQIVIEKGQKLYVTAGTTQTIGTFKYDGTPTAGITLSGVTAANYVLALLNDSDGNFLTIDHAQVTGKTLFAGDNSVDAGGNNSNVVFGRMFYPQTIII